jgi:hypothetical protein
MFDDSPADEIQADGDQEWMRPCPVPPEPFTIAPTPAPAARWELVYAYQLQEGDLVSGDEDALDAMTGREQGFGPEGIDWEGVHQDARTVAGKEHRFGGQVEVTLTGDEHDMPLVVDDNTPILRYTGTER